MIIKHLNSTQLVASPTGFLPLMRNEVPYFENLNRPAKSAYDYIDLVNTYVSYGGHISILKPGIDSLIHPFHLYDIVTISDNELIIPASPTDVNSVNNRFGIVVVEADINGSIVVCTFCPNFVYPDSTIGQAWGTSPGNPLYLSTSPDGAYLSGGASSNDITKIGSKPLAVQTGANSIFFCGTYRLFPAATPQE